MKNKKSNKIEEVYVIIAIVFFSFAVLIAGALGLIPTSWWISPYLLWISAFNVGVIVSSFVRQFGIIKGVVSMR